MARSIEQLRTVTSTTSTGRGGCVFEELLGPALAPLLDIADADIALVQRYGSRHGAPVPRRHVWRARDGAHDNMVRTEELSLRQPDVYTQTIDLRAAPAIERRTFLEDQAIWERPAFERSAFYEGVYIPSGISRQQRLLAWHGPRFLGWVGFLRVRGSAPFAHRERTRLQPLVAPVIAAMAHADRLEWQAVPGEPADLLVDGDGRVEFASLAGQAWLLRPAFVDALRRRVRSLEQHDIDITDHLDLGEAKIVRLDGDGGRVRYLVHVVPLSSPLTSSSSLTPMQQSVAERAALGMTIDEVANELHISAHTARSHLKEAYRRLHVATRVELADALREGARRSA